MDGIKPNFFTEFEQLGEEEKTKGETDQEQLHFLSETAGWKHVKKYVEAIVADLDATVLASMANGASFEDIGRKTAVKEVTKDVLNRILSYVDNARASVERAKDRAREQDRRAK